MAKVQRIRITFARSDDMKFITHLDMMRFWERALRRANVPIAHSEGFSPHAQISLAAPLAVGVTSEAELMDVYLAKPMVPRDLLRELCKQLPAGVTALSAQEVGMALPALQADVRFAEYYVDVSFETEPSSTVRSSAGVQPAIDAFLAADTISWEHRRDNETRSYDIRAQIASLATEQLDSMNVRIHMRLKNDNTGSGRPEQVIAALGLPPPARIHRTKLILEATSSAKKAWRTRGRFE
jgi:radical SAM-linked protein